MEPSTTEKRSHVISLLDDAYASRINNLARSVDLGERALCQSRDLKDNALIGKSLSHLSLFYMIMGEYKRSMEMSSEAIGYFKELNDEKGIADAKYNIAGVYYKTDNFHLGLVYLIDCLAIYRKFNDFHNQARVHKSLGTIYEYFGDQNNAVKAYESSIEAARRVKDLNLESNAYNPLSGIYLKQNKIEKALDIIERAVAIKKETGDIRGLAFSLYGRAKVFAATGKFREAAEDFTQALDIHRNTGERLGTGMVYRKLGALYIETGELGKAKKVLEQALEISEQYNIAMIRFKSNYLLYQVYKLEADPVRSIEYLERYLVQKEAVINAQTLQVIENYELITKMEALEKDAQLQREKAEIIEKKNLAEQASKLRQDFLSTMSHEIRTPLNAVIMISSLLKDRADNDEQELLSSLKFAANNLLRIVNDILDFTRLDSGKAKMESHPVNLSLLMDNLRKTYDSLAKEKGLKLSLKLDPAIGPSYELDETKITQILGNLISNAIKYTEHGHVDIEVAKKSGDREYDVVAFSITDTGVGIAEGHLDEIFDIFSQPHSITTRKQGGSGLGLAIVKKLVQLYESEIHVKSTVGEGSTFSFELRAKKVHGHTKTPARELDELRDKTVLLAEDNIINAMVAIRLLSNWGIKTKHAKNGVEAVEMARQGVFDLILMDLHMPEMNGFDATRQIRESGCPNCKTPVFALTADITADQQEEYVSFFDGFLKKPIEIEKMYDTIIKVQTH